jgi:OmpA-OmpF porin, OOP family
VARYAPITLAKAKNLLAQAEKELNENRYDADLPRALAREANYEAKHAIHLSEVVRDVRDRDVTVEEVILKWEGPLREIASAADISADLSTGHEGAQGMLVEYIENMRGLNQSLEQEREQDRIRLSDMEEEIRALDDRLGGATAERAALVQRLEAEARVREQFAQVEKMFSRDEARVLREGDNIILRLVGLTFDSGKANLPSASFDLLAKVERAIDVFPQSELIIEGHTDSFGGDELNQRLSQERAESVKQYMINAMRIPAYRLISVGYGETNPIANNETEGGRARNRRIDIVIKPNLDAMSSQATYNGSR